jgi:hypothetical protein
MIHAAGDLPNVSDATLLESGWVAWVAGSANSFERILPLKTLNRKG